MEKGFSYLHDGGKIFWDIRYSTSNNITGSPLPGYDKNIPIGTIQLKEALKKAVDIAESEGLYLFLFDAYRPQKAVDRLVAWAKEEENNQTKTMFYPNVEKKIMIKKGYKW